MIPNPREGTPILGHGMEVPLWWPPVLGIFNPIGSLFYTSTRSDWPPLSSEKIELSLLHSVPETLGPKFGIIFHQNLLFNRFQAFCINFLLNFRSNWPPFSLILNFFDPSFSQKLRSNWVQIFIACWTQLQNIWWSIQLNCPFYLNYKNPTQEGALQYLNTVGNFALLTPVFDIFRSHWVPFYVQLDLIDPFFLQKKSVCLYHI